MHTTTLHSNQTVYPLSEVRYDTTHLLLLRTFYFTAICITQQRTVYHSCCTSKWYQI